VHYVWNAKRDAPQMLLPIKKNEKKYDSILMHTRLDGYAVTAAWFHQL